MPVTNDLILRDECCIHYNIEVSFLDRLHEYGLIEMVSLEEKQFIHTGQLSELEKFIRLHRDLELNVEGIGVVSNLLDRMKRMQQEMAELRNRLYLYRDVDEL
ncbi:MAG: chaperone modulator CbpM [Chitinophagaceae bacterium]|nr:chaperone modulator CbpM [Chitinophagaceae bacterium]